MKNKSAKIEDFSNKPSFVYLAVRLGALLILKDYELLRRKNFKNMDNNRNSVLYSRFCCYIGNCLFLFCRITFDGLQQNVELKTNITNTKEISTNDGKVA